MKLRLINLKNEILFLCPNGTILKADDNSLARLLKEFDKPNSFKGNSGIWNEFNQDMSKHSGITLAYVDDEYNLVVLSNTVFSKIINTTKMISANEYADLHGKGKAIVKRLCLEGRIPGAQKHSTGWLIPKDAPYPKDQRAGRDMSKRNHKTEEKSDK